MRDTVIRWVAGLAAALLLATAGAASAAGTAQPVPKSRHAVGDWVVECYSDKPEPQMCQTYQRILASNATRVAMAVSIAWSDASHGYRAEIALPLGVELRQQPALLFGKGDVFNLAWDRCTHEGCFVKLVIGKELADKLLAHKSVSVGVVAPGTGVVRIPLSLKGFGKALEEITPKGKGVRAGAPSKG